MDDLLTRLGGKEWLLFLGFSNVYKNSRNELVLVTKNKGSITISREYYTAGYTCLLAVYKSSSGEIDSITTQWISNLRNFIKSHTSIDLEAFSW